MPRSKSSKQWLKQHHEDVFVKRSREEGYRSRASYKLLEILKADKILRPGMAVIDLGAAPGGWCQVAKQQVGASGRVIACDLLPMDPLPGVEFIQGDFTQAAVLEQILDKLKGDTVDLVISDMAPNMTGVRDIDQPQSMHLAELALDLARSVLSPGAYLLVKTFQGEGFEQFLAEMRASFRSVKSRKPEASRAKSREIYLLASGFAQ